MHLGQDSSAVRALALCVCVHVYMVHRLQHFATMTLQNPEPITLESR